MIRGSGPPSILGFTAVAVAGVLLRPALPVDETRYLAVAWEMWTRADWLVPTKNFAIYTHKPPLLFWAIDLVWSVTGVSEVAARLVGPGFAVLALLLTGRLARRLWPGEPAIGGRAMLALAGSAPFALYGGLTMFDAALAAATIAGVTALVGAVRTGRTRHWIGFGVALAAGALIKGPVILLHLGPVLLLAPVWAEGRASWRQFARGGALALATGIGLVALWLVPAIVAGGPGYRDAILWTQSAGRISTSFAHAAPWWTFAAALPVLLFPWALVPALWRAGLGGHRRDAALRLCLIWAGTAFILFSLISGKQLHYLVPELPAAALIVARIAPARFSVAISAGLPGADALVAVAAAAGLVPLGRAEALIAPRSALLAWAFVVIALCLIAIRRRGLAGGAILTLGTILAFDLLIGLTSTRAAYDAHVLADATAPFETRGIAFYGQTYHAELNFAGRLTRPVATPRDAAALARWEGAHPGGVVVARADRDHPPGSPSRIVPFRNAPYGIWPIADAGPGEPAS